MKFTSIMITFLSVLGQLNSNSMEARITRLKKKQELEVKPITQSISKKYSSVKKGENDEAIKKIKAQGERIEELLKRRTSVPVIWEQRREFKTGSVVRGTLLNSIVSSNLASPVLIQARSMQGFKNGTLFSCSATTRNKRVLTICNRMIEEGVEHEITAMALNLDGSAGLVGIYDDRKEEMIESAVISEFASGMLSAAQTRVAIPYGDLRDSSLKNQLLEGLVQSGNKTSDILIDEAKTLEPIVTVNAGTEVLIYFMEALNENP
ncbi:TrbI/VirB10 family protein [Halobacteriovorax vibrionivorans]|uniref:TrbI/VirB10 family protein n=1 Tax=Halobacteriovorax vibrionivorans TaxID=2152716 RepID=A0ABY0IFR1_9BACT|nr:MULTISPECIES: TrbI/VirB10 family protein [Halobacteriovorax]RZF20626.1 TrbI/VirB10 family protein [Halobacteriovorax vibrionivorans]TGD48963.1 TrbI/VirB10 family protein [Halobacteriovorax sp. Y22]